MRGRRVDVRLRHWRLSLNGGVTIIRTLLYNVTPTDPLSFAAVAVFLMAVALLASYVPARRPLRVDPLVALRGE